MKQLLTAIFLLTILCSFVPCYAATYNGKSIDKQKYLCMIWSQQKSRWYNAQVIFSGNRATIYWEDAGYINVNLDYEEIENLRSIPCSRIINSDPTIIGETKVGGTNIHTFSSGETYAGFPDCDSDAGCPVFLYDVSQDHQDDLVPAGLRGGAAFRQWAALRRHYRPGALYQQRIWRGRRSHRLWLGL